MVRIPKGKRVVFRRADTGDIIGEDIKILLDEDITLNLTSHFGDLVSVNSNNALTLIGSLANTVGLPRFSGQFKQFGYQIWQKTDPLTVSFTASLHMIMDAYNDVVKPSMRLIKLPLPEESGNSGNLIAPSVGLVEALDGGDSELSQNFKRLSCSLGRIRLPNIIVKGAEPTYSKECDERGYPIYCKIRMTVSTIHSATTRLIDRMFNEAEANGELL